MNVYQTGTAVNRASVAVITGAASGLGLGMAHALVQRGMNLVIADIDADRLSVAEDELVARGAEVEAVVTDVTKQSSVAALADRAVERFGRADVVCLNAGVSIRGRAWELTEQDWRWVYDVNVFGVVHGIRSFVPSLLAQDSGHVVITASNSSVTTLPSVAPYVSSKHAVLAMAETLQHDLAAVPSQVLVSVVLPGAIRSNMADAVLHRPAEYGTATIAAEVREASRQYLERYGEDPLAMADRVLRQALDDHEFCIFSVPSDVSMLADRAAAIRDGRLAAPLHVVHKEVP